MAVNVRVVLNKWEKENTELTPEQKTDILIRRFKKQVRNLGIIEECHKREYFKPKSVKRKEKQKEAMIRKRRAIKKALNRRQKRSSDKASE